MKLPRFFAIWTLAAATFIATGSVGTALAQERVLRENQVTRQGLIDALMPQAAQADAAASAGEGDGLPRSRSFRPATRPGVVAGVAAAAAQPARASILITFITSSSDLTPDARRALDVLAGAMKSDQLARVKFTIEGHADPRGDNDMNMKLSQARADSVRAYLIAQHGLAGERVNAVGKGSSALMNPSEPAAPENRRVTIVSQPG